eukprot:8671295-Ditylum_brightwellii.AAC.1
MMESQSHQGIAVGQSSNSDCMMMFCAFNQRIYHTNNYRLDESGHTATSFNLRYNGDGNIKQVSLPTIAAITCNETEPPTIQSSQLVLPQLIEDSKKVTLELDGKQHLDHIQLEN